MDYEWWNQAIADSVFSTDRADETVYLAIDREAIEDIARKHPNELIAKPFADFVKAVRFEIEENGWDGRVGRLETDQTPGFVGLLAAQVVVAFDMRADGEYTDLAYWPRHNRLLGIDNGTLMPRELYRDNLHQRLWTELRRWANKVQGGRWGRVRLAKTVGHKHIARPLGQCLLRRCDLDQLRVVFQQHGSGADGMSNDELKAFIERARDNSSQPQLSRHTLTVIDERYDDAFKQITEEYGRFLQTGGQKQDETRRRHRSAVSDPALTGMSVWLSIGKKLNLTGGLCTREENYWESDPKRRSLAEVLERYYLRFGRQILDRIHRPHRDDRLLAVFSEKDHVFIDTRHAKPADHVIILVSAFNKSEWIDQVERIAAPGTFRRFRSAADVCGPDTPGLRGLPSNWVALKLTVREDLAGDHFGPELESMLKRATYLRVEGGLLLRRGRWMAGAGPTLRVVPTKRQDRMWIDDRDYPIDEFGRVTPEIAPTLDQPGSHRAWLPGEKSAALTFAVERPNVKKTAKFLTGWKRIGEGWPDRSGDSQSGAESGPDFLFGPRLVGEWRPITEVSPLQGVVTSNGGFIISNARLAVSLLLGLRCGMHHRRACGVGPLGPTQSNSANPLVVALGRYRHRPSVSSHCGKSDPIIL